MSDPDAIAHLVQLYQRELVPEEYHEDVINSIGRWGQKEDLNILFDMAVQDYSIENENVSAKLDALVEAARQRDISPDRNINRIVGFLGSDDEEVVLNAVRLVGHWRMEEMSGELVDLIHKRDLSIKRVAMDALASLKAGEAEELFIGMATESEKNSFNLRALATTQLVKSNATEAAHLAVQLLKKWPENKNAAEFFKAFLSEEEGTKALAEELMEKQIPEDIAKAVRPIFERQIPWGRQENEDVKLLRKALESSGGNLPTERMPQQLSDREIESLALEINRANGNPDLGEDVFRKINCVSCHAIGGAGGLMGPDLSSLGTSSPVETIIKSILVPSQSIKEGYELQRVVKTDGSVVMGHLVSDSTSEIVIRDMTGQTFSIAKNNIDGLEKVSGSLMPPGLTASLEKEEFIDMVSFLSKLGESGKYRVPNERFVRRWEIASPNKGLSEKINDEGLDYIIKENADISFQPAYSKVSGDLPIEELPKVEVDPDKQYSFVRFEVEVLSKGNVDLWINLAAGIRAWVGQRSFELSNRGAVVELSKGINDITLAIDRNVREQGSLKIQLRDAEHSPAQIRLVMEGSVN